MFISPPNPIEFLRLYGDELGETHFEICSVEMERSVFAPPAPPLETSEINAASGVLYLRLPHGWAGDWHPSPTRQNLYILSGDCEFGVSDGEIRRAGPGDIVLLDDVGSKGHTSRVIGDKEFVVAAVQLGGS